MKDFRISLFDESNSLHFKRNFENTLESMHRILTGNSPNIANRIREPASALSANGTCMFYSIYEEINASPMNVSTIRVTRH